MREPRDLSYHDLQQIVESIQRFLTTDLNEGQQIWNPNKESGGADVCNHITHVLSQYDLVPWDRQRLTGERQHFILGAIDGPTFRKQRQLLLNLAGLAREGKAFQASDADQESLDGLVNLTDAIADEAHDKHGVDCLLDVAGQ
jgi:hypothetical protein